MMPARQIILAGISIPTESSLKINYLAYRYTHISLRQDLVYGEQ